MGPFPVRRRWIIVALLFVAAVVNSLDRQTLSVLAPTLRGSLGFGAVEYSYVVAAFLAAYSLGYTFCGSLLDKVGVRIGLALALVFWSVSGMLHAAATTWVMLAGFRFLLGLGESFNSPAGVKAVAEWMPPRERGLSMAIVSNGNVIGAIVAPPLVAFLSLAFGWRWAFLATGAAGLAFAGVWFRQYASPEVHPRIDPGERAYILASRVPEPPSQAGRGATMLSLLRDPLCVAFFAGRFMTDSVTYFFSFWLPDYLTHARGFTLAMLGLVGWLPFLASDVGGIGGGALSDWFVRRGWSAARARFTLMAVTVCLMPLAGVAVRMPSTAGAVALIALLLAAQSCWMANQLTFISESVAPSRVGTFLAMSALGGSLGGIASTLLTGRIVAAWGYVPIFTLLGVPYVVAFGLIWTAHRIRTKVRA